MALPLLLIFHAGRVIQIAVRVGTALARFIAKNPGTIGGTISLQAISSAIQSYNTTEKEKIDIVVPIIFGFFATKRASAVPTLTAI